MTSLHSARSDRLRSKPSEKPRRRLIVSSCPYPPTTIEVGTIDKVLASNRGSVPKYSECVGGDIIESLCPNGTTRHR